MDPITIKARTSYDDLVGTISIDFPGDLGITEFANYASSLGIDLTKYRPIGLEIFGGEGFAFEEIEVSIYAVDSLNEASYKEENGKIPVVKFYEIDTLKNLFTYLHRLNISVFKKFENLEQLEIVDQISKE